MYTNKSGFGGICFYLGYLTMYDVICIGDVAVDDVYHVDRLPGADQKVHARALGWQLGGTTCNTAVALKVLGNHVLFVTLIGKDKEGKFIQDQFKNLNIDFCPVQSDNIKTPTTQVLVANNGEKAILLFFSVEEMELSRDYFRDVQLVEGKLAFTTLSLPVYGALSEFKAPIVVSLEEPTLEHQPWAYTWAINHAHTLILDRCAYQRIYHEQPTPLSLSIERNHGNIENLIVTMGSQGSITYSRKEDKVIVTPTLDIRAVDTTGAGDIFNASFIHSYYILKQPLEKSLQYANTIAAFSCEDQGTTLSYRAVQRAAYLLNNGKEVKQN